ncbi:MAG: hypothetical protein ACTSU5_18970 [Promethearchaeota archaeon]
MAPAARKATKKRTRSKPARGRGNKGSSKKAAKKPKKKSRRKSTKKARARRTTKKAGKKITKKVEKKAPEKGSKKPEAAKEIPERSSGAVFQIFEPTGTGAPRRVPEKQEASQSAPNKGPTKTGSEKEPGTGRPVKVVTFSGFDVPPIGPSIRRPDEEPLVFTKQAEIEARLEVLGQSKPGTAPGEAGGQGGQPPAASPGPGDAVENRWVLEIIEKVEGVLGHLTDELGELATEVGDIRAKLDNTTSRLEDLEAARASQMGAKLNASQLFELVREITADYGSSGGAGGQYFMPIADFYWMLTMKGYQVPPQKFRRYLLQLEEDGRIALWDSGDVPLPEDVRDFYRKQTLGVPVGGRGVMLFLSLN